MTMLRVQGVLLGAAVVTAALASGRDARAAEDEKKPGGEPGEVTLVGSATTTDTDKPEKDKAEKKEGKEEEKEKSFSFDLDFVVGSAKTDTITQTMPGGSLGTNPSFANYTPRVTTYSFILSGGYEFTEHFGVGVRLPVEMGEIFTPSYKGTGGIGNIELEAEGEIDLAKNLGLELALGLALPTANGAEYDPADPVVVAGTIDQAAYDRYTIQRATAMARGYEDNALYEPHHFGLIPKVKLEWGEKNKWHVDPWIKLENLMGTTSGLAHSYVGELVFGANAGVYVVKQFEPGLRLWVNAPLSGADFTTVAVAEPELRFHFGDITPKASIILPLAGPLANPYAVGVRLALAARF